RCWVAGGDYMPNRPRIGSDTLSRPHRQTRDTHTATTVHAIGGHMRGLPCVPSARWNAFIASRFRTYAVVVTIAVTPRGRVCGVAQRNDRRFELLGGVVCVRR